MPSSGLNCGPQLRPFQEGDADAVVVIYRATFGDRKPIDAAKILAWIRNPEVIPEQLQVAIVSARIVGYGDIVIENDEVGIELAAPGCWDTFPDWAEREGRSAGVRRVVKSVPHRPES